MSSHIESFDSSSDRRSKRTAPLFANRLVFSAFLAVSTSGTVDKHMPFTFHDSRPGADSTPTVVDRDVTDDFHYGLFSGPEAQVLEWIFGFHFLYGAPDYYDPPVGPKSEFAVEFQTYLGFYGRTVPRYSPYVLDAFELDDWYDATVTYRITPTAGETIGDPVIVDIEQIDVLGSAEEAPTWYVDGVAIRKGKIQRRVGDEIVIRLTSRFTATLAELSQIEHDPSSVIDYDPALPNSINSRLYLSAEEGELSGIEITSARFAGAGDTPSSLLEFGWSYQGDETFSGSDSFVVGLWHSSDPVFDDGDVPIGHEQQVVVDSLVDSGGGGFDFGSRPLLPDKVRPYVLVVIQDGPSGSSDHGKAVVLPYLDVATIQAEMSGKKKRMWLSTLMHESSFALDMSRILDDREVTIEARRIGKILPGQTRDWVPFVTAVPESSPFGPTLTDIHRLPGQFEYRAAVTLDGATFTSEKYHGNKKAQVLPQIDVRFPHVDEIRASELFTSNSLENGAVDLWNKTLDTFAHTYDPIQNTAQVHEFGAYVGLDTATGEFFMSHIVEGPDYRGIVPVTLFGWGGEKLAIPVDLLPLPMDVEREDGTGVYLVADFHTHPVIIGTVSVPGPSEGDVKSAKAVNRIIQLPGFVYTHVGHSTKKGARIDDSLFPALPDDLYFEPAFPFDYNVKRRVGYIVR